MLADRGRTLDSQILQWGCTMSLEYRSGTPFRHIPAKREPEFNGWSQAMSQHFPNAEAAIRQALNDYIDAWLARNQTTPNAAFCSSWIPGPDWRTGTGVYQPIYLTMMNLYGDHGLAHTRSGWFFGLILMDIVIHRAEGWECWHEKRQPEDSPEGLYYRPRPVMA